MRKITLLIIKEGVLFQALDGVSVSKAPQSFLLRCFGDLLDLLRILRRLLDIK